MHTSATATADVAAPAARRARPVMRYFVATARLLLGAQFLFAGLNYFFDLVPPPDTPMPEGALSFAGALMATGYMFPLIKGTEVVVAVLLLANRFVPLALLLLAPVLVNIVAFHAFLAPAGLGITIAIAALFVFLAWSYRKAFYTVLAARNVTT